MRHKKKTELNEKGFMRQKFLEGHLEVSKRVSVLECQTKMVGIYSQATGELN